jgi:hypothetical protein
MHLSIIYKGNKVYYNKIIFTNYIWEGGKFFYCFSKESKEIYLKSKQVKKCYHVKGQQDTIKATYTKNN